MLDKLKPSTASRRTVLAGIGASLGASLGALIVVRPAGATPQAMAAAIRQITNGAEVKRGRIKLDVPPLVENGNSVTTTVKVESPLTPTDYVKAIHVLTEKNPQPNVISVKMGPRAGKAEFQTRIRLADSQQVVAICEMSDGSFWSDSVDVILTLSACMEDPV